MNTHNRAKITAAPQCGLIDAAIQDAACAAEEQPAPLPLEGMSGEEVLSGFAPLAARAGLPVIVAGVRTAAVMSVGTATIAAFIGAGGYGERITIGLALADSLGLDGGRRSASVITHRRIPRPTLRRRDRTDPRLRQRLRHRIHGRARMVPRERRQPAPTDRAVRLRGRRAR